MNALAVSVTFLSCGVTFAVIGLATRLDTFLYLAPGFAVAAGLQAMLGRRR